MPEDRNQGDRPRADDPSPRADRPPVSTYRELNEPGEWDGALRPRSFDDFIGQEGVKTNLRVYVEAARMRRETLDHVLLSGYPGLGKTSLCHILGREMGSEVRVTSGPALERPRDLVGVLTSLQAGDFLFIDEIHRLPRAVEEYLYAAMEDFAVDVLIDQGPNARSVRVTLKPFTLVGATTREGLLAAPFRARFGVIEKLDLYDEASLGSIVRRSAALLAIPCEDDAAALIARSSRGIPRIANRLLRRIRDVAQVEGAQVEGAQVEGAQVEGAQVEGAQVEGAQVEGARVGGPARITAGLARRGLDMMGIDAMGLETTDRRLLAFLARLGGGPVGLKTLAMAVGEEDDTIEEVYEPYLVRLGLIEKTPRGRRLTEAGARHVSAPSGTRRQETLF
ncbi:MAG: Holliday junction branch migration DNA helicase RuvB [Planctomycetota bacterium]